MLAAEFRAVIERLLTNLDAYTDELTTLLTERFHLFGPANSDKPFSDQYNAGETALFAATLYLLLYYIRAMTSVFSMRRRGEPCAAREDDISGWLRRPEPPSYKRSLATGASHQHGIHPSRSSID
jgi:hypothetical protein